MKAVWYGRSVIRSRYKLTYEVAQSLYDGAKREHVMNDIPELVSCSLEEAEIKIEELRAAIKSLVEIARVLRERRAQGGMRALPLTLSILNTFTHSILPGAVELESVEVRVQLSSPGDRVEPKIEDLVPKQPMEMHETIAECMIFANHWVAKRISESFPSSSLLRHHPPPSQDR